MKKYELKKLIKEEIKSTLKEGIWALGTKKDIQMFIQDIEDIKEKHYDFVGSDAVYNGLDQAIVEAEELLIIAKD
tara:strand:- start:505 stop:729 length:225 start_codon:yes stop_codon:yes gene_type:complete